MTNYSIKDLYNYLLKYYKDYNRREFENELARLYGVKYAIALNSGRSAILLALYALNIDKNKYVLLSALNYAEIPKILKEDGWKIKFVDINKDSLLIDKKKIKELIEKRNNIGAVIITYIFGIYQDFIDIIEICKNRGIAVIEDSAHTVCQKINSKVIGTFGDAGILSFEITKPINALGGGAIITSNDKIMEYLYKKKNSLKTIKNFEILKKYSKASLQNIITSRYIYKYVVYPIQKILFIKFDIELEGNVINRRQKTIIIPRIMYLSNYQSYAALKNLSIIEYNNAVLKKRVSKLVDYIDEEVCLPILKKYNNMALLLFPLINCQKKKLKRQLLNYGIDTKANYMIDCSYGLCKKAKILSDNLLSLPLYPSMKDDEFEYLLHIVRKIKKGIIY